VEEVVVVAGSPRVRGGLGLGAADGVESAAGAGAQPKE